MVSEQWVFQAIAAGKTYDSLPTRIKNTLSFTEWKNKVKHYCIQHGDAWADSIAHTSSGEQEYYEELLEYYKKNERLFPYHLAHYVCRILRVTAFRYYSDILFNSLKEEKAYDKIPNFTAADILRHLGIGRNEYISILDACRAKKFIWRMNRNIAKERLPNEPVSMVMEPWWRIGVVNLTESEFKALMPEELEFLHSASSGGNSVSLAEVNYEMLRSLYRRGLLYLRIPIREDDKFTIPPLEGFISNRNVSSTSAGVDPMETLLYSVFIANSENMTLSSLADVLKVDISALKAAMGIAVRLGFATRVARDSDGGSTASFDVLQIRDHEDEEENEADRSAGKALFPTGDASTGDVQSIAVLVDAETTSFLMMGLLSSGIKRHAVTLFEGGRVAGDEVISHLISELRTSADVKEQDEEIRKLMQTASSLAELLECVKEAAGNGSIELLRRESLEGLSSEAVTRILSHSYKAIVPIAPLSGDPLPLSATEASPLFFGATDAVASLWFQLACFAHFGSGPISHVFVRGQRVTQLPRALQGHSFALLFSFPFCKAPHLVMFPFILHHLNELCRHGHVLLQPLFVEVDKQGDIDKVDDLEFVDVPLPLATQQRPDDGSLAVQGYVWGSGKAVEISILPTLPELLVRLGLTHVTGFMRFSPNCTPSHEHVPFHVFLGVPLAPLALCNAVCASTREQKLFDVDNVGSVIEDKQRHVQIVTHILKKFGHDGRGLAPQNGFLFDGHKLRSDDYATSDLLLSPLSNAVTPTKHETTVAIE